MELDTTDRLSSSVSPPIALHMKHRVSTLCAHMVLSGSRFRENRRDTRACWHVGPVVDRPKKCDPIF